MLLSRIIPVLLCRGEELVKGAHFDSWRGVGSVMEAARLYAKRNVDELLILDVAATREGRGPDFDLIGRLTDMMFCPVTVGGGIRCVEDVRELLRSGADKIAVGTRYDLIPDIAHSFGCQAVVASVDYRGLECYTRSGEVNLGFSPVAMAKRLSGDGAGEILLNSIDRDGTMQGYDLDTLKQVCSWVNVPVIACGGCSGYDDMGKAIEAGASAVAAGAVYQFTEATPRQAARHLKDIGHHTRI